MTKRELQTISAEEHQSRYAARTSGRHIDDARGRARLVSTVRSVFPCLRSGVHKQTGSRDHGPSAKQNQNQNQNQPLPPP